MNKKGQILLTVILVILIFSIIGVSLIHLSRMESIRIRKEIYYLKALNLAEAGIERALWKLEKFEGAPEEYTDERNLGDGGYSVSVEKAPEVGEDWYRIVSTGKVNRIQKGVKLEVKIERGGKWPPAFEDYGIFWANPSGYQGSLRFRNAVLIKGDAFAYGNIKFENAADLQDGKFYATGSVTGIDESEIGEPSEPLPERVNLDTSYYEDLISQAEESGQGSLTFHNQSYSLNGQTLFVNGNIILKGP